MYKVMLLSVKIISSLWSKAVCCEPEQFHKTFEDKGFAC